MGSVGPRVVVVFVNVASPGADLSAQIIGKLVMIIIIIIIHKLQGGSGDTSLNVASGSENQRQKKSISWRLLDGHDKAFRSSYFDRKT